MNNSDSDCTDAEYVPDKEDIQNESDNERKCRKSPTLGLHRSKTWSYFSVNDLTKTASCKLCTKEISFKSLSDLKLHINVEHSRIDLEEDASAREKCDDRKPTGRIKLSSMIWKYFECHDSESKIAICKACGKHLLYHTLNNLKKHLVRSHGKLDPGSRTTFTDSNESTVKKAADRKHSNVNPGARRGRLKRSKVWKFFTIADPDAKVATCNICSGRLSYTTMTNLKKHLNRKHGDDTGEMSLGEEDGSVEVEQVTPVWAYFKSLDKTLKIAACLVCKKRLEYSSDEDLVRHINRKHPYIDLESMKHKDKIQLLVVYNKSRTSPEMLKEGRNSALVPKKLMITGDGSIYEIDDDVVMKQEPEKALVDGDGGDDSDDCSGDREDVEALHASETYLNESIFDESPHVPSAKRYRPGSGPTTHRTPREDSLDLFGQYVVSLLRKLPAQQSDRLQVEFIQQLMEAQNREHRLLASDAGDGLSADDARVTSNSEQITILLASEEHIQDTGTH